MPYKSIATGRLYPPVDESDEPDKDALIDALEGLGHGDPVVSHETANVTIDELYYSDGELCLTVPMGGWYVSLNIPLRPSDSFATELGKMNRAFNSLTQESGYFLNHEEIDFVDTFEPDSQGRVTLGKDHAETPIKLLGTYE